MANPTAVEDLPSMERLPSKTVAGYGAGRFAFNLASTLSTASLLYYDSWMVPRDRITAGDWDAITKLSRAAMDALGQGDHD